MMSLTKISAGFFILMAGCTALSLNAGNMNSALIGKIELGFMNSAVCTLADYKGSKTAIKGKTNLSHDEENISWTSTCVIRLPKNIQYCSITSQEIVNPDTFFSWYSGFQMKVLRAKIVSESDINPGFGKFKVTYHCFE